MKYKIILLVSNVLIVLCLAIACKKSKASVEPEKDIIDTKPCCTDCVYPSLPSVAKNSKYLVFNGSSNYINVANHDALNIDKDESFTVTCWIRSSSWKNMPVFRKRDASNLGYEMTVGSNGSYIINMRSTTGVNAGSTVTSDILMVLNGWYHLAMVLDKESHTTKTYINGELQGTTENAQIGSLSFENAVDVTIGHSIAQNRFFLGFMDDIRVWNKALTKDELLADMKVTAVNNTTPNLIAAWDFEKVTGNTVPDVSGNGHTGTIIGTVTTGDRSLAQIPGATVDSLYRPSGYQARLNLFKSEMRSAKDIVFVGNSITAGTDWSELLANPNAKNRGISGDITFGVLARLDEVLREKPAKVFVLIGINDLAGNVPDHSILNNYKLIIKTIKSCSPSTKIYFNTLLPLNNTFTNFPTHLSRAGRIPPLNSAISAIAAEENIVLIDSYNHFKDVDGQLNKAYTNDGLHLTPDGYKHWALILKAYVNQ
ncbi:GDSL-type esterase/lipase family protein [Pedobacter sp.]